MCICKKGVNFLVLALGLLFPALVYGVGFPVCPDVDLNDEVQLAACLQYCIDHPDHYACNWSCELDPDSCVVPKPDCSNPQNPGCKLYCMANADDPACDYLCAVAPDLCQTESACEAITTKSECDTSVDCQSVNTPNQMVCQDDGFVGCGLKYTPAFCQQGTDKTSCDLLPGCMSELILDANDAGETVEIFIGCRLEQDHAPELCTDLEQDACGASPHCVPELGRVCEMVPGGGFAQCVSREITYDVCLVDPFDPDCEWNEIQCSKYPEYWKCKPSCLEHPDACSGMPEQCGSDPESCQDDFVPLCAYGVTGYEDECASFCMDHPTHWGCNWECVYGDEDACASDPYLDCHRYPDQEGCPDFCAENPLHPSCDYICTVTGVCPDMADVGCSSFYDRSCNNVCQVGDLSASDIEIACHQSCQIDRLSSSCAPAAVNAEGEGVFASPYCSIKTDANCESSDQKFCELYPEDDHCSLVCTINPFHASCPHFCEVYPLDPGCCTLDPDTGRCEELSLEQSHPDVTDAHWDQLAFCSHPGMEYLGLCDASVSDTKRYCDALIDADESGVIDFGVCDAGYDVVGVFEACDFASGDTTLCLDHSISLEHTGFSDYFDIQYQGHCAGKANCTEASISSTYQASDSPINIGFLSYEPVGMGPQSGINFSDASSVYISHVIIRELGGGGREELFVNPGIVHKPDQVHFEWNINQHRWAGTDQVIFSQVGVYEFVLGVCDKAGNCQYTPKNIIEIVPGNVSQEVFQSSLQADCVNPDDPLYADGGAQGGCFVRFRLADRFGNPVIGSNGQGYYRSRVLNVEEAYHLEESSDSTSALSGIRFRDAGDASLSPAGRWTKVASDGATEIELVSFLPTVQVVHAENVCGDGRDFYAMTQAQDVLAQLQIETLSYNPDGSLRPLELNPDLLAPVPVNFASPFMAGVSLTGDFDDPVPETLYPQVNQALPVYIHGMVNGVSHPFANTQVTIDAFSGSQDFYDKDFTDPTEDKTYDFPAGSARFEDETKLVARPGRGAGGDQSFSFATLVSYTVPESISGIAGGVEVSYPGQMLGYPRSCGVDESLFAGLSGVEVELPEIEYRTADVEGRFIAKQNNVLIDSESDLTEIYLEKYDTTEIRSDLIESVRPLIRNQSPQNLPTEDVVVLDAAALASMQDGGVSYFSDTLVVLSDDTQDELVLQGKHTIVIEDGELLIADDLIYDDVVRDSWGFVLYNSDLTPPPFDPSTGLYTVDRNDADPSNDFYGNIFVSSEVKQMVGTYFADGVFTSTVIDPLLAIADRTNLDILDVSINRTADPDPDHLFNQLVLTGMLSSQNTFGGSFFGVMMQDPWGRYTYHPDVGDEYARIFDLHYVRQYLYGVYDAVEVVDRCSMVDGALPDQVLADGCYANGHPFVIRIDNKAEVNPPPGFELSGGLRIQ